MIEKLWAPQTQDTRWAFMNQSRPPNISITRVKLSSRLSRHLLGPYLRRTKSITAGHQENPMEGDPSSGPKGNFTLRERMWQGSRPSDNLSPPSRCISRRKKMSRRTSNSPIMLSQKLAPMIKCFLKIHILIEFANSMNLSTWASTIMMQTI